MLNVWIEHHMLQTIPYDTENSTPAKTEKSVV